MPAKGVLNAVELQRRMIEDDLLHKRNLAVEEATSVLRFCRFIETVKLGLNDSSPCVVPVHHVAFYWKIVMKLVEAGELPAHAQRQFEAVFAEGFLKTLAA
jgi:hypothetical protein